MRYVWHLLVRVYILILILLHHEEPHPVPQHAWLNQVRVAKASKKSPGNRAYLAKHMKTRFSRQCRRTTSRSTDRKVTTSLCHGAHGARQNTEDALGHILPLSHMESGREREADGVQLSSLKSNSCASHNVTPLLITLPGLVRSPLHHQIWRKQEMRKAHIGERCLT